MTALTDIRLSENRLTGTVPFGFSKLVRMEKLHLSDNKLTGTISPFLFKQTTRLVELSLSNNHLEGTLPTTLSNMGDLGEYLQFTEKV